MTRGRTPSNATPEVPHDAVDAGALMRINNAAQELSVAEGLAMDQADLYKVVGRIESAHFLETVSSRLIGEAYSSARILIGKLGEITVRTATGERKRVSSLDDFCDAVMPVSARRCRQIAQAMHTLGPALYEQAEIMGLGARNYAAIRALPLDMQEEVKEAISTGSREQVLQLMEELAARNASLTEKVEEQDKSLSAKDAVLRKKDEKINRLAERLELKRQGSVNEREAAELEGLRGSWLAAESALLVLLHDVDTDLAEGSTDTVKVAARQTIDLLVQRIVDACLERGIAVDLADRVSPIYMQQVEQIAACSTGKRAARKR